MSSEQTISPLDILRSYFALTERFFGLYLDACAGFDLYAKQMVEMESRMPESSRALPVLFSNEDVQDPNDPSATYNHSAFISDVIARNRVNGQNEMLLAHSLIVFIYSVWDTVSRPAYCAALGVSQDDVKSDVMGDLRLYRNAIVHGNLILKKEAKVLRFVAPGSLVFLARKQVTSMLAMIFRDLTVMHERLTGEKIDMRFERFLNPHKRM